MYSFTCYNKYCYGCSRLEHAAALRNTSTNKIMTIRYVILQANSHVNNYILSRALIIIDNLSIQCCIQK